MRNLLLPLHLVLAVDLRADVKVLAGLRQQRRADHDGVRAHDLLVMVDVRCALRAVIAIYGVATVALVLVVAWVAAVGDLQVGFGDDLRSRGSGFALWLLPGLGFVFVPGSW